MSDSGDTSRQPNGVQETSFAHLQLLARGKVRDVYAVDSKHLLIVATDRISAFDVVLPQPIPGKGEVLTRLSQFWFANLAHDIPNHCSTLPLAQVLPDPDDRAYVGARAMVVKRLQPLPIEAIVRGYIIGSGWKDYQGTGAVSGIQLPQGLRIADRLAEPIFTPSTKADAGGHDENVSFDDMVAQVGGAVAEQVRERSVELYQRAGEHALARGIIIADTKFEFAVDEDGTVVLIDELLTPDSSRFWPADERHPGHNPPSFDKQFVRDYLETLDWDKTAPAPALPDDIIALTAAKYAEAERRLTAGA
ncbi:MAG: phosphoribosylaminoimidazolesuccinocarboxamide synthase [Chromatiales bacterium]|jgi:phosphoribosylaminoimidazole-succinocarboxamide synthase|nr:phosphoribosylaminoimidazolesuccinocarboxamide synthase [Chromatiales bacterium]